MKVIQRFAAAGILAAAFGFGGLSLEARAQAEPNDVALEAMEPQELPAGRCAMFLWTRSAEPSLVFVAYANPAEARARTGGRNRYLRRTAFAAEMAFGHFEKQTFTDGRLTFELDVQFDGSRGLRNGAVVKEGVIRSRDANRWESVTPVGGLVACEG